MKKSRKIWLWSVGIVLVLLAVFYFIGVICFTEHFLYGTSVNGKDISLKTVREVEKIIEEEIEEYTLILKEKDSKTEQISGAQIGLQYQNQGEIKRLLGQQNPFLWCSSIFKKRNLAISAEAGYDKARLTNVIRKLSCYVEEEISPQDAVPEFDGTKYIIKKEVSGSGVDKEKFEKAVEMAVDSLVTEVDLQKEGCYLQPKYTSESQEVIRACEQLNQYLRGSVTYTMDVPVAVDAKVISGWLSVDENMNVKLNESGIKNWLTEFGDKYDTMGITRTFTTPNGKVASVTGGTYGWSIDEEAEFTTILNAVKNNVGSHGCINMPIDKAGELYNMIEVGVPVVIHY